MTTEPSDSQAPPSANHVGGGLHEGSTQDPPAAPDSVAQHEPQHPKVISEAGNQYHHDVADEQPPQGSGVQEDPRAGATSGGGPLAGIPPPRRAYTMLAPREMKDRLESTRNRTDGSESDTVESVRTQAGGSATAGSNLPEASRAAEPARGAKVATSSTSRSTPAFQKMSHLGRMFCTALEQGNMGAAATSAVAVQEHGCGPLSLHL